MNETIAFQPETREKFFSNRSVILPLILLIVGNLLTWAYLAWRMHPQSEPIYLHYTIYFGVDLIGAWYRLYFLPGIGLVAAVANIIFARLLYKRNTMMAYLILWVTGVAQFLLLLGVFLIVQQNI